MLYFFNLLFLFLFSFIINQLLLFFFPLCMQGVVGDAGPEGPSGDPGPKGIRGRQGSPGADGVVGQEVCLF